MRRCEDEKMWRWEDVKMSRCKDEQMKMSRCEDEQMWRWADVKMSRCEDEQMWRWEDVKMSRCEDEQMWRWEDEIQTPTIGRTLRSDALGKKARCQKHTAFTAAVRQASYQVWARPSSVRLLRWILQKSIGLAILGSRKTWFPNRHVYCLPESKTSFCHSWSAMAVDKIRLQKWVFSQANSNIVKRTLDVHSWKEPEEAIEMAAEDRQLLLRFAALLWFQLYLTLIWR